MKIRHERKNRSVPYYEVPVGAVFEVDGVLYLEVSYREGCVEGSVRLSNGVMVSPFASTRMVDLVDAEVVL